MNVYASDPHGLIPRAEVLPGLAELISRCGSLYRVDRAYGQKYGLVENTLRLILKGKSVMVRRRTAWGVQQALYDQRRYDDANPSPPKRYHKHRNHFVSRAELVPFTQELIWRCGSAYKAEQRYGIPKSTLLQIVNREGVNPLRDTSKVRSSTAQRILSALSEQRRYDRENGTSKRYRRLLIERATADGRLRRDFGI